MTGVAGPGGGTPRSRSGSSTCTRRARRRARRCDFDLPGDRETIRGAGGRRRAAPRAQTSSRSRHRARRTAPLAWKPMTASASSARLRLPDDVLDDLAAWQAEHRLARRGRPAREPARHARVPRRPAGATRCRSSRRARAAAPRARRRSCSSRARYRETRSVGMVVFATRAARRRRSPADLDARLERPASTAASGGRGCRTSPCSRFREPPAAARRRCPELGPFSPSDAAVYSSVLRPGGAEYEVLETVALGGR